MTISTSYLVQILVPTAKGSGEAVSQEWFDALLKEFTEKFGGATSFARSPGEGLWRDGGLSERDSIAVVEVMVEELDAAWWHSLRERLELELEQEAVVIRAQEVVKL